MYICTCIQTWPLIILQLLIWSKWFPIHQLSIIKCFIFTFTYFSSFILFLSLLFLYLSKLCFCFFFCKAGILAKTLSFTSLRKSLSPLKKFFVCVLAHMCYVCLYCMQLCARADAGGRGWLSCSVTFVYFLETDSPTESEGLEPVSQSQ